MTERPAGFDQAVEVLTPRAKDWVHGGRCGAYCHNERSHHLRAVEMVTDLLTALLAERVAVPCPDTKCRAGRVLTCPHDGCNAHTYDCPVCHGSGKVASDVPLIVMGSEVTWSRGRTQVLGQVVRARIEASDPPSQA